MAEQTREDIQAPREFCPRCFADNLGGSWGEGVLSGHCMNCGASPAITIPAWAVRSIREQASWVGKRYYPCDEDREISAELETLRAMLTDFPGRFAESTNEPGSFRVTQLLPGGGRVWMVVDATTINEALDRLKTKLRYVSREQLGVGGLKL